MVGLNVNQLPKLPPKASEAFKRFAKMANKGRPFYIPLIGRDSIDLFTFWSCPRGSLFSEDEFYRLLVSEGFSHAAAPMS